MDNGLFWVCLAARYSSKFDATNPFLNRSKGPKIHCINKTPIYLMSEEEQSNLDDFVQLKMQHAREGTVDVFQDVGFLYIFADLSYPVYTAYSWLELR
jgi:hypothetical protein